MLLYYSVIIVLLNITSSPHSNISPTKLSAFPVMIMADLSSFRSAHCTLEMATIYIRFFFSSSVYIRILPSAYIRFFLSSVCIMFFRRFILCFYRRFILCFYRWFILGFYRQIYEFQFDCKIYIFLQPCFLLFFNYKNVVINVVAPCA